MTSKKCPDWRLPQAIAVKRGRGPQAATDDHAVARAGPPVAGRAEDIVLPTAPRHCGASMGNGKTVASVRRSFPCTATYRRAAGRVRRCLTNGRADRSSAKKVDSRSECIWADRACPVGMRRRTAASVINPPPPAEDHEQLASSQRWPPRAGSTSPGTPGCLRGRIAGPALRCTERTGSGWPTRNGER